MCLKAVVQERKKSYGLERFPEFLETFSRANVTFPDYLQYFFNKDFFPGNNLPAIINIDINSSFCF